MLPLFVIKAKESIEMDKLLCYFDEIFSRILHLLRPEQLCLICRSVMELAFACTSSHILPTLKVETAREIVHKSYRIQYIAEREVFRDSI